jgi:hypothetical protein
MESSVHQPGALPIPQGQPSGGTEGWNVAVFSPDRTGGEEARRQVESTLGELGLRAVCHLRQWRFAELGKRSVFEEAVVHALEADLVIVCGNPHGLMGEHVWSAVAEWLIESGVDACPLVLIAEAGGSDLKLGEELFATLRGLTDRPHATFFTNLREAMLVASDLWPFKHAASAASSGPGRCRLDAVSILAGDGMWVGGGGASLLPDRPPTRSSKNPIRKEQNERANSGRGRRRVGP